MMFKLLASVFLVLGLLTLVTFYAFSGIIYALLILSIVVIFNGVAQGRKI